MCELFELFIVFIVIDIANVIFYDFCIDIYDTLKYFMTFSLLVLGTSPN